VSTSTPSRSGRRTVKVTIIISGLIAAALADTAHGQDGYNRGERVYEGQLATVPLQPFSLDPQSSSIPRRAIRVAYYSAKPAPRGLPNNSDSDAEDEGDVDRPLRSDANHPTVPGNRAVLRNGIAYAPANAPNRVKAAIWAVNSIRHKPYHWGGGHGSFYDSGYDCSGAVSYALHFAGALNQPLPSSDLLRYGERGHGRWITIYSRRGHTFAIIAGLRLDTTDFRYGGDVGPRWYIEGRSTWGFDARHPAEL
jgi:cell wall-associated NlpC family hydrolase